MSVTEFNSRKMYRYAIPMIRMKILGTYRARRPARSFVHGVVKVSRTTSETDVATRMTSRPAPVRPCSVIPTGWPFQCHSGRTIVPGVMKLNIAGITMMPVKIGMNSHTRLTKNPIGSAETIASRTVAAYITTSVGMFRTNAVTISRPRNDRIFTRGSSRWRKPRCWATSSPNIALRITPTAPERVFSTKLPFFRLPMHPHGHSASSPVTSHVGVGTCSACASRSSVMPSPGAWLPTPVPSVRRRGAPVVR